MVLSLATSFYHIKLSIRVPIKRKKGWQFFYREKRKSLPTPQTGCLNIDLEIIYRGNRFCKQ